MAESLLIKGIAIVTENEVIKMAMSQSMAEKSAQFQQNGLKSLTQKRFKHRQIPFCFPG